MAERVLLVDADAAQPDIDLKLGAGVLDEDQHPDARLDRILLQLPELAERRVHLDSLVWIDQHSGLRVLLAPGRSLEIGREHLDYLYTYSLAPAFDAIVVDVGRLPESPEVAASFWLGMADVVLVPLRPTASHARAAVEGMLNLERLGVSTERCRLMMGVDREETAVAVEWQRRLDQFVTLRWPWVVEVARRAAALHRPLIEVDGRFAQSVTSLLPAVAAARQIGR